MKQGFDNLHSIRDASALIAARRMSPVELVQQLIQRNASIGAQVNAFVSTTYELAIESARRAEHEIMAGRRIGPLHGVPYAAKDIIDTAHVRTAAQSHAAVNRVPDENASVVERMNRAGAVLLGKVATHEFAHAGPPFDAPWPPARNPWNPSHFTGGSSSGSGAAVAAGLVPAALGTDTGGSIRVPAGLCGVAGFKPSYGLVSRTGIIPNSWTFDHCGPLAWTVEDCAILLTALAGHDPRDVASKDVPAVDYAAALSGDIRGMRIGVARTVWWDAGVVNAETIAATEKALGTLVGLGAQLQDVKLRPLQDYTDVKLVIAESELFAVHQAGFQRSYAKYGSDFLGRTLGACLFSASDYVQAQRERSRMLDEFRHLFRECDVIVTVGAGPAPLLEAQSGHRFADKWTTPSVYHPFSISGGPTLSVCSGFASTGLPVAMQISGRVFDDATVLNVGHAFERATPWRDRRPTLTPGQSIMPISPRPRPQAKPASAATRGEVAARLLHAGIEVSEEQFDHLAEAAPSILDMARRIRREGPWSTPPAHAPVITP